MLLKSRSAELNEIADLFQSHGRPWAYPEEVRLEIPLLWQELSRKGALRIAVYEDLSRGRPSVVGISVSAFVSREFMEEALANPTPHLGHRLYEWTMAGRAPLLSESELRRANEGEGLDVVYFADPMASPRLSWEEKLEVDSFWAKELYQLRCVNLREFVMELCGSVNVAVAQNCGVCLRHDYEDWWGVRGPEFDGDRRPFLIGLNREEAMKRLGSHASTLFITSRPRIGFSKAQQELLRLAVEGETDAELAMSLFLTLSAVKKRWTAIYAQVSEAMPGLLPENDLFSLESSRGVEKRRHLLNYLRQHPEELELLNAVEKTAQLPKEQSLGVR